MFVVVNNFVAVDNIYIQLAILALDQVEHYKFIFLSAWS
jgi:hypothetical protein